MAVVFYLNTTIGTIPSFHPRAWLVLVGLSMAGVVLGFAVAARLLDRAEL